MIVHVDKNNFQEEVLNSNVPVLVDFWAAWCRPCQMVLPILESLALDLNGKAKIVKINVDAEFDLADQYKVMSIPTLIVFKNGQIVNQTVGIHTKESLLKLLNV